MGVSDELDPDLVQLGAIVAPLRQAHQGRGVAQAQAVVGRHGAADALRDHQYELAEVERDLEEKNELWANWS